MHPSMRFLAISATVSMLGAIVLPAPVRGDPGPRALPPQVVLEVPIAGSAGVPHDAAGAVVNLTVTNPAAAGFATVFPCGAGVPDTSNLNYPADTDRANTVLAPLSAGGSICVATSAATDVIVDVFGYVPTGSSIELLDPAVRGVDTRSGLGAGTAGPVPAGATLEFDVSEVPGVGDAGAVALNVTSVGAAAPGFVTVAPCDRPTPGTSTLNHVPGRDVANLAITPVAADGTVCITTNVAADLVIDVAARIARGTADPVMLDSARRAVDSRLGIGTSATRWAAGETRPLDIDEHGVPAGTITGLVNLTATRAATAGFVSIHRCGTPPQGSNLNFTAGVDVANAAFVRVGPGLTFCATASAPVDLIVDVVGAVAGDGTVVTFDSVRVYDSREEARRDCRMGIAHPAPDTLWVVDLVTGRLAAAISSHEFVPFVVGRSSALPALITPACNKLIVTSAVPGDPHSARLLRAGFDGTVVEIARFDPTVRTAAMLSDGTLVYDEQAGPGDPPEIVPVAGGSPIFTGAPFDDVVAILDDDRVGVTRFDAADRFIWAIFELGATDPSATAAHLGPISPGRRYQLVGPSNEGVVRVTTFDGATVVSRDLDGLTAPDRALWSGVWIDDGLVVLCATGTDGKPTRSFVWNIFSSPVEIPVAACIAGGR